MGLMFSLITFESDKNLTFLRYYLTEDFFLCACKNFCPKCIAKKVSVKAVKFYPLSMSKFEPASVLPA